MARLSALLVAALGTLVPGPVATLVRTCAPWDGAAIALFLTDRPPAEAYPPAPYVSVTVYRSLPEILGRRFEITPESSRIGSGQVCPATGPCRVAARATVSFAGLNRDSTVGVTYRIELGPKEVISGRIRARLNPERPMCG